MRDLCCAPNVGYQSGRFRKYLAQCLNHSTLFDGFHGYWDLPYLISTFFSPLSCLFSPHSPLSPLFSLFSSILLSPILLFSLSLSPPPPIWVQCALQASDVTLCEVGDEVFVVNKCASYVTPSSMVAMRAKGSDASNWFDEEISADQQEFSDDEEEAQMKRDRKGGRYELLNVIHSPLFSLFSLFSSFLSLLFSSILSSLLFSCSPVLLISFPLSHVHEPFTH